MRYRALPLLALFAIMVLIGLYAWKDMLPASWSQDQLRITPEQARRQRFALILDVRTPKEREEFGYYPNSMPVALSQLAEEVPYLLGEKPGRQRSSSRPTPLLIYSNAGDGRAKQAAELLYELGFVGTRYIQESYLPMLPPGQTGSDA